MRNLTHYIKPEDCVGDSIAKHNFNFLILDTFICNISSSFFNGDESFKKYCDIFNSNISKLDTSYNNFNSSTMFRYDVAYSTVKILSSYWLKNEFSVALNFNISKDYSDSIYNNYTRPTNSAQFEIQRGAAVDYLNQNFPPNTFSNTTTANVIIYYHTLNTDDIISSLNQTIVGSFNEDWRDQQTQLMTASLNKFDVSISGVNVFKFDNSNPNIGWNLFELQPSPDEQKLKVKIGRIGNTQNTGVNNLGT